MLRAAVIALMIAFCLPLAAQKNVCGQTIRQSDRSQYEQAVSAYKRKDYNTCGTLMRKVSAKNPRAADPYFYLGMCAVHKDFNAAGIRRYFTKLMTMCPDYPNPLAHFYLGVIYYSDDRFDEAVESMQRYFDMNSISGDKESEAAYAEASNYLYWATFLAEATKNQVPFFPSVVRGVSSKHNETLPYLSPDGKQFYYLRQVPAEKVKTFYTRDLEEKVYRLYMSRLRDTAFTAGEPLEEPFNQGESEGNITVTADGRLLYYSVMTTSSKGYANCDIFYTVNRGGKWDERVNAGRNVNGDNTWESQPSITPDGRYLYFASNRQGGYGGTDIWRCRRLANGDWSRAENLGPSVNTSGNEKCPFIHADGHTLYFASDGWQGFGGYDLYFINTADNYSQRPTNLGLPINSERDEIYFGVTADGSQAYYAGRATDYNGIGGTDIFMFDLYPAARPEPMTTARTQIVATDGAPLPATLTIERDGADAAVYIADSVNGTIVAMLSSREDNLLTVNCEGYAPFISEMSAIQVRQGKALPKKIELKPMVDGGSVAIDIRLNADGSLNSSSQRLLRACAEFLLENPMLHAIVEMPHKADAKVAHDYLLEQRLRPERLTYRGGTDVASPRIILKMR